MTAPPHRAMEAAVAAILTDVALSKTQPAAEVARVVEAVLAHLPPPVKPDPPQPEDVESIPDQRHDWGKKWDGDVHGGRICSACGYDPCTWCDPKELDALDCLQQQAEDRNYEREKAHREAMVRYEAQLEYFRAVTGRAAGAAG